MAMTEIEYKFVSMSKTASEADITDVLNAYGRQGWAIVQVFDVMRTFLLTRDSGRPVKPLPEHET